MTVKIGLVGTGTVGGGCLDILTNHAEDFKRNFGADIQLAGVCSREPERAAEYGVSDLFTEDYHDLLNNPEIDVIIELIGGTGIAKDVIMGALEAGKHVVTANKAVMASYGEEVFAAAAQKGLQVFFGASVGGGIPIIGPMRHSLIANQVTKIMGIVNGTTNFMLSRMNDDGLSYDAALKEAQDLGYAEADPTADVDGFDAAAKIAILASLAFHTDVRMADVYTEGIRNLNPLDFATAKSMGYAVKLVAHANLTDDGVFVRVHPTMLPLEHQMASVNGVFNAIYVVGDAVGQTMFFGEGAGAGPAASAVMGDVVELARRLELGIPEDCGSPVRQQLPLVPMDNLSTKYYIRFKVKDRPGVLAASAAEFSKAGVSVKSVSQRGNSKRDDVNLVFVTHTAKESDIRAAIKAILALDNVVTGGFPAVIRVEE
ncbi:MAG: homoserine dehydrogenase [Eggerthellales bacterium]|nr:homoserine dehydrogenase [Eggerthellales bacterium]